MAQKENAWWNDFFEDFRPVFNTKPQKETNAEARYFIKKLNLKKSSTFLDCAVGIGRMAIPLAKQGIKVTGVDITPSYLAELKEKTDKLRLPIKLFHNDMRRINFDNEFDAAGNLWTSFGYFEKESDNLLVLKKMYKALKAQGKFVLQTINRDWIIRNFESTGWSEYKGLKILEKREFDYRRSIMNGTWTFIKDGQEKLFVAKIRIYSFHEIAAMFEKVGFVDIAGYGNIKDDPITHNNRNMIVIGTKGKK